MTLTTAVSFDNHVAIIGLVGDWDIDSTSPARDAIREALADPGLTRVVVDLAGVSFLDSSALGVLVAARRASLARGTSFGVRNPGAMATMVLRLTGLFDELVIDGAPSTPGGHG